MNMDNAFSISKARGCASVRKAGYLSIGHASRLRFHKELLAIPKTEEMRELEHMAALRTLESSAHFQTRMRIRRKNQ